MCFKILIRQLLPTIPKDTFGSAMVIKFLDMGNNFYSA